MWGFLGEGIEPLLASRKSGVRRKLLKAVPGQLVLAFWNFQDTNFLYTTYHPPVVDLYDSFLDRLGSMASGGEKAEGAGGTETSLSPCKPLLTLTTVFCFITLVPRPARPYIRLGRPLSLFEYHLLFSTAIYQLTVLFIVSCIADATYWLILR